jgi:hypothetical protein
MANPLEVYLADHLAGAEAALDLLDQLAQEHEGDLQHFFRLLHTEITADREELERLMHRFGFERSRLRSTGARLAGRLAQVKLVGDDSRAGAFRRLEALDMLQGGIEGKRALWRAMQAAAERDRSLAVLDYAALDPALAVLDYDRLAARAEAQRERVDAVRLDAARAALTRQTG